MNERKKCKSDSDRIAWIDTAKGLAMLSIVLGHAADKNGADAVLLRMSMFCGVAMFFFLSGMTFCWKSPEKPYCAGEKDSFKCVQKRWKFFFTWRQDAYFDHRPWHTFGNGLWKTLIFPYLCWSVISIVIYRCIGAYAAEALQSEKHHFEMFPNLLGMLYGNSCFQGFNGQTGTYMEWNRPLWFLTCLTMVKLIWYFLLRCGGERGAILRISVMFASWICLLTCSSWKIRVYLPWELETAVDVLWIFGLGRAFRILLEQRTSGNRRNKKAIRRGECLMGSLLSAVLLFLLLNPEQTLDFRADCVQYPHLLLPEMMLGATVILGAAISFEKNRILSYIGRNTLAILAMHKFILILFQMKLGQNGADGGFLLIILWDLFMTLAATGGCLAVEKILEAYFPWLFAKPKSTMLRMR